MKIRDNHKYHGAALDQIAEHDLFTAINVLKVKGKVSRSAYRVNDSIAVYLKYATRPQGRFKEYVFTFTQDHLAELEEIASTGDRLFLALVCVKDREICCVPYKVLRALVRERKAAAGLAEDQYTLLVTLKPREAFRVCMNQPGERGVYLSRRRKVPRNRFPNQLFV